MHFHAIPLRNIFRRPVRSVLTTLGVAAAIGSLLILLGISAGVQKGWDSIFRARGTHLIALRKGTVNVLAGGVPMSQQAEIAAMAGVRCVFSELLDMELMEGGQMVGVAGWEENSPMWRSVKIVEGRGPAAGETNVAVLGQAAADVLKKHVGDSLRLRARDFQVIGIYQQGGQLGNFMIVLPLAAQQERMSVSGVVTGFNLQIDRRDDAAWVKDLKLRLESRFPGLSFYETRDAVESNDMVRLLRAIGWGISVVAIVMASVIIANTLLMSVNERTREIGILTAVGWNRRRVLRMVVTEGVLLTTAGSLLGEYCRGGRSAGGVPLLAHARHGGV